MPYKFVSAPYAYVCDEYGPIPYSLVDYQDRLFDRRDPRRRKPDAADVIAEIGLDSHSHLSACVTFPETEKGSVYFPREQLVPLARGSSSSAGYQVEVVRSYGRGYVQPNVRIWFQGAPAAGGLAIKGSGVEASAVDNLHWLVQEHQQYGVIPGRVHETTFVNDLFGEFWARKAGFSCPVTIYCAKRGRGYQVARLWRCPYRIWELTSGPFRTGPSTSEVVTLMNWEIELIYALKFRIDITARARACAEKALKDEDGDIDYGRQQTRLIGNIVKAVRHGYQLSPFTMHLANVSYSGETSGFDRILGPFEDVGRFRLGVLSGLLDTWAAVSWLGAVVGERTPRFAEYFRQFQEQLAASGAEPSTTKLFLEGDDASRVFSTLDTGRSDNEPFPFPFSARSAGDIEEYVTAAETFFSGLAWIFQGQCVDAYALDSWLIGVDFDRCERARIQQEMGGDVRGTRRNIYLRKVREQKTFVRHFSQSSSRNRR